MARNAQHKSQVESLTDKDDEEPLVSVTPDAPDNEEAGTQRTAAHDQENEEEEEPSDGDERLSQSDDDAADKAKHPRETSRERRLRHQRSRDRNRIELNFLRTRNDDLERRLNTVEDRTAGTQVATIDAQISTVQQNIQLADQIIATALDSDPASNPTRGRDVVEAQKVRDELRDRLRDLTAFKNHTVQQAKTRKDNEGQSNEGGGAARPKVDERLVKYAQDWAADNPWYDPKGRDEDSQIVQGIDNALVASGLDPRTPAYWKKLSERVQKRLPHLFDESEEEEADEDPDFEEERPVARRPAPKKNGKAAGGPKFTVRGRERQLRKNEVYISAERKQALMDAGAWDDPQLRQKYLKRYQEYDREKRSNG